MSKKFKKIISLILSLTIIFSLSSVNTFAASYKKIKAVTSYEYSVINKKASVAKKGNSYFRSPNSKHGYIKFKAPKAGKYKITFSNVKRVGGGSTNGYVAFYRTKRYSYSTKTYLASIDSLSTQGGKASNLQLASAPFVSSFYRYSAPSDKASMYRTSRSAKIKMAKGETIYIYSYFTSATNYKVNIKKV